MQRGAQNGIALAMLALTALAPSNAHVARAIGFFYADPGWVYAFDGDSAYYHDPDGPNPDYINGNDQNQPGGQGGQPALVAPVGGVAQWIGTGQWDGSAPGDPLGGTPTGSLVPPLPPAAPGGVGAFTEPQGTTFLRIQDAGYPQSYGWADKGAQLAPGTPRQEGNNRRMLFGHDIANDPTFSGSTAVIDNGITITFRTRLATHATGPVDDMFPEGGSTLAHTMPWPEDGLGYDVHTEGRGMFMVTQTAGSVPGQLGFSLLDDNTVAVEELAPRVGEKRGLVMNNRANPSNSPSTNNATPASLNIFEIPHEDLDQWQEFWITIQKLPTPIDGNTHEVNVYHNGSLTPQAFQIILDRENEFRGSAYLAMGLSSDTRQGAFDVDFIAYKEGVHVPTLNPEGLPGDYNDDGKVDVSDYVVWRENEGTSNPLQNDEVGGQIGQAHYDQWRQNFGATGGGTSTAAAVPEPISLSLLVLGCLLLQKRRLRRRQTTYVRQTKY